MIVLYLHKHVVGQSSLKGCASQEVVSLHKEEVESFNGVHAQLSKPLGGTQ